MKKIIYLFLLTLCAACNNEVLNSNHGDMQEEKYGVASVAIRHEAAVTKALTDYVEVLDVEKAVNSIAVFVFDNDSGVLNAYKELDSIYDDCVFSVTTGEKAVYVVINGPDLSYVMDIDQLEQIADDLSVSDIHSDGLVMVGREIFEVESDEVVEPVVVVRRLVSRVVVTKITNNLPPQYGTLSVDCVYLGNASSVQTYSGDVSEMVNPDGYEDSYKNRPIGKDGVTGACSGYMYRAVDTLIDTEDSAYGTYHLYCHPNGDDYMTCLYLLTTINGDHYYYRVPLYNGMSANTTCSVELEIVNLGSSLPPDGDFQKGEIRATISISGWDAGENYVVEF